MSDFAIKVGLGLLFAVVYGLGLLFWRRSVVHRRRLREEQETSFVTKLLRCYENMTVASYDELVDLYSAHFSLNKVRYKDIESLYMLLSNAILRVSSAHISQTTEYSLITHLPLMRKLLKDIEQELEKKEIEIPFSRAPLPERQLLLDILEMTSSDKDLVRGKLKQLADSITVRQDTIVRLGDEGRQSLKWAKWGLAGTILFSLASIALAIWK